MMELRIIKIVGTGYTAKPFWIQARRKGSWVAIDGGYRTEADAARWLPWNEKRKKKKQEDNDE